MTRTVTYKRFDKPCTVCKGVQFNTASDKCTNCVRINRIAAVREKCQGRPQIREVTIKSKDVDVLKKAKISYSDMERITL